MVDGGHPGVSAGVGLSADEPDSLTPVTWQGSGLQAPGGGVLVDGGVCWSTLCAQRLMPNPRKRKRKWGPNHQEHLGRP